VEEAVVLLLELMYHQIHFQSVVRVVVETEGIDRLVLFLPLREQTDEVEAVAALETLLVRWVRRVARVSLL
jgi:hypothetical protein